MSFSCASKKNVSQTEPVYNNAFGVSDTTVIAKYRTTVCFGKCPAYEVIIKANGECTYNAMQNTKLETGLYSAKIDTAQVNELHRIGERIGFKNYKNLYTNPYIVDKPSVFLSLYIPEHDSIKTVERIIDYPQEIWDLEKPLRAISENSDWKKITDSKE
mgnify:CR=1 FL=1